MITRSASDHGSPPPAAVVHPLPILDATAGFRSMWINKTTPGVIYLDRRPETKPTIIASWHHLPFPRHAFRLVFFDPPHDNFGPTSLWANLYGHSTAAQLHADISAAAREIHRVLHPTGFLIAKWSTRLWSLSTFLHHLPNWTPLAGQVTHARPRSSTHWLTLSPNP